MWSSSSILCEVETEKRDREIKVKEKVGVKERKTFEFKEI